jgi:hypothetical protein
MLYASRGIMSGLADIASGLRDMEAWMGYKGKSAMAACGATILVYGAYFLWAAAPGHSAASILAHMIAAILGMVAVMVTLEIAMAVLAARRGAGLLQADERDALIGARSARNGYYALLSLIWLVPVLALSGATAAQTANGVLAMIVLAELVHFGSRVMYDVQGV